MTLDSQSGQAKIDVTRKLLLKILKYACICILWNRKNLIIQFSRIDVLLKYVIEKVNYVSSSYNACFFSKYDVISITGICVYIHIPYLLHLKYAWIYKLMSWIYRISFSLYRFYD